jgi:ribose transport system permease protein
MTLDLRRNRWLLALAVLIVLGIVYAILEPRSLSPSVMQSNLTSFLPLILVAIGQTYVVLAGDIDLSIGAIIALVNVTVVTAIEAMGGGGAAIAGGMLLGLAVGLVCGLVNGICVAVLRFQSIVTTFATSIIFSGAALWVLPQAGGMVPEGYWRTYAATVAGINVTTLIFVAAVAAAVVVARTLWYRHVVATGGNLVGAFQTGLPVERLRLSAYLVASLFAGLAALCLVGETASADPLLGPSNTLSSVSAVVLGGTALAGGAGGAVGSVIGALILGVIGQVIFFAGLPYAWQDLVKGAIVLLALAGGVFVARR